MGWSWFGIARHGALRYRQQDVRDRMAARTALHPHVVTPNSRGLAHGVARNTALNLASLAVPLLAALLLVPVLIHSLGAERFGLLGIGWAALEYLSLFDAGISRATTQFVAVALQRDDRSVSQISVISLASIALLGTVGAVIFAAIAPLLVTRAFHVAAADYADAVGLFRMVALNVPIVLLLVSMRGILEGAQRFDVSAVIKIATGLVAIGIPALAAQRGATLTSMMFMVFVARVGLALVLAIVLPTAVSRFRWELPREWHLLRGLFGFGVWVATSSLINPLLIYLDRLLLGALVGMAAVGVYTAPYEMITRVLVLPASLAIALFPTFATLTSDAVTLDPARVRRVLVSAERQLLLVMMPITATVLAFAPDLLRLWLGARYAESGAMALRILSVGVLANAVAHPPSVLLQGSGRPGVNARFHLLELAIHVPLTWLLVSRLGVPGAALAWTTRVTLDLVLLRFATRDVRHSGVDDRRTPATTLAFGLLVAMLLTASLVSVHMALAAAVALGLLVAYAIAAWQVGLDVNERNAVRGLARRVSGAA